MDAQTRTTLQNLAAVYRASVPPLLESPDSALGPDEAGLKWLGSAYLCLYDGFDPEDSALKRKLGLVAKACVAEARRLHDAERDAEEEALYGACLAYLTLFRTREHDTLKPLFPDAVTPIWQ